MIAIANALVKDQADIRRPIEEPRPPALEHLNTSDPVAMKNIVIRPIELTSGPGFELTVMEAAYTYTQELTGEQLGEYLRRQAAGYEHLTQIIRRSRQRRAEHTRGQ